MQCFERNASDAACHCTPLRGRRKDAAWSRCLSVAVLRFVCQTNYPDTLEQVYKFANAAKNGPP